MSKKLIVFPALLKAHVAGFTRKDGAFVKEHDTKVQAAAVKPQGYGDVQKMTDAIHSKHGHNMLRKKSGSWEHGAGPQLPAADIPAGTPEFSHKEVYGHDEPTRPWGGNNSEWSSEFKAKQQHGFVLKHPSGKRSLVSSGGDGKAAYFHAPIADAKKSEPRLMLPKKSEAKTGSAAPAKEVNVGSEKWPMQAKSSEKLAVKKDDGSTHHVGGFEPPSDGKGDHLVHHDGKSFSFTGKSGKNTKTGEASYEYSHRGDGGEHRAWVTHSGHLQND